MKKLLLTTAAVSFALILNAQNKPMPKNVFWEKMHQTGLNQTRIVPPAFTGNEAPIKSSNKSTGNYITPRQNKVGAATTVIGTTTYDLQSNGAVQNRLYQKNGTVAGCWTMSQEVNVPASYSDRGAGYNYYDGSSWSGAPTGRIETDRRGWPSLLQLANGSEVVVSHGSVTLSTAINTRPTAGSGAWAQTLIPDFPGGEKTLWVRTAAGGPDGNTVHMIDISYPTGNGGVVTNGLDGCMNYSRSLDGGQNWDIIRVLPTGISDMDYNGFRADGYAIDAKDNTVAFVSGGIADDWALWKSTDNGSTWTRTIILDFPWTKFDNLTQITDIDGDGVADQIPTTDGTFAVLIDNNGLIHCLAGAMEMIGDMNAAGLSFFPGTNGILYWNETMATDAYVVIAQTPDIDGDGQLITFATDLGAQYGLSGLSTWPTLGVDASNNLYASFCPLIETSNNGAIPPDDESYRNAYLMASSDGGTTWTEPYAVEFDLFTEQAFAGIARNVDNCISIMWQQDFDPGVFVQTSQANLTVADMVYDCVDVNLVLGVNDGQTANSLQLSAFPNPVSEVLTINYNLVSATDVQVEIRNVLGQVVETITKPASANGTQTLYVNVSKLNSGIYTVNTIAGNKVNSTKFVKY